ncbi:MAG: putative DNA binding domain-containing protein [Actinomycetota bacterium]|nr:putative DNA binding domain-containing protein [Actinomycetota bacterium]
MPRAEVNFAAGPGKLILASGLIQRSVLRLMVERSDARAAAVARLLTGVLAEDVDTHERSLVDGKEDPSRRGPRGVLVAGEPKSELPAKTVADPAACFANASGGVVIVGVNDKVTGWTAFVGTQADIAWFQNRVRQLVSHEIQVAERHVAGARIVTVTVEPSYVPLQGTSRRHRAAKRRSRSRRVTHRPTWWPRESETL